MFRHTSTETSENYRPRDDEIGFTELFYGVYRDLYVHILRRVGPDSADDVLAETLTTLWVRWSDAPASMAERRAWTFGIARYKLSEEARARNRRARLAARLASERPREAPPADSVAITDQSVSDLLARLRPCERDVLELSVIAGLTTAEVAAVLGCSLSAVTSNAYRARKRLERCLSPEAKESAESAGLTMRDPDETSVTGHKVMSPICVSR